MTSHLVRKVMAVKMIFAEMVLPCGQAGLDSSTESTVVVLTVDFIPPNLFEKGKNSPKKINLDYQAAMISRLIRTSSEMYGCTGKSVNFLKRNCILAGAHRGRLDCREIHTWLLHENRRTSPTIRCLVTAVKVVTGQSRPQR